MDPINKNDFFSIGSIIKPHGLKGDLILEIAEGYEEVLEESEYLMVEVEGGLVPFFISAGGVRFRSATTLSLAFDGLESAEKAKSYCGCQVYLHKDIAFEPDDTADFDALKGYKVFDSEKGLLGEVIHVDNFSGNVVLTVLYKEKELLLPFSEELIIDFDERNKTLHLNCPDGLIEIYLE